MKLSLQADISYDGLTVCMFVLINDDCSSDSQIITIKVAILSSKCKLEITIMGCVR